MLRQVCCVGIILASIVSGNEWSREFTVAEITSLNAPKLFQSWLQHFNKNYKNEEEKLHRFQVWLHNLDRISKHNSESKSFKMKLNQFGDLSEEEFEQYVNKGGYKKKQTTPKRNLLSKTKTTTTTTTTKTPVVPTSVDWVASGKVTPVKDQGQCGSCWTFSTTGATECRVAIKTGVLNSLSEQQLVDCCNSNYGNYYSQGCEGGDYEDGFAFVKANGGLCSEAEYPYLAYDVGTCYTCTTLYDTLTSQVAVTINNPTALEVAVSTGCVSVSIEADSSSFQFYSSGIFDDTTCGTSLDHAVLVVGYYNAGSASYWKIKNSWGTDWGENGYILFAMDNTVNNGQGVCGLHMEPVYPVA
jgi:C1A family cysteine protease